MTGVRTVIIPRPAVPARNHTSPACHTTTSALIKPQSNPLHHDFAEALSVEWTFHLRIGHGI